MTGSHVGFFNVRNCIGWKRPTENAVAKQNEESETILVSKKLIAIRADHLLLLRQQTVEIFCGLNESWGVISYSLANR